MKLSNSEYILQIVLDLVREAITIIDADGIVTHWNQTAEELYQIPASEIIGKNIDDFEWKSLKVRKIMNKKQVIQQVYHEPMPGTHVLVNTSPIFAGKEIIGAISSEQDITKLVRLGNELFTTTSQLHLLEDKLTKEDAGKDAFHKIKGHGSSIKQAIQIARRVAVTDATVLISGESGVGKELFAQAIHHASPRAKYPFIAINCAAIPSALFETELFGYQGGSFTGADRKGRSGKIELAHQGTLFLDEIGELPLEMQAKLLRVLQERQFYRVGGTSPIQVDFRIIAATNRNLADQVARQTFREDLFYRLNVVSIEIPSLRERIEDIPELIQLFAREMALRYKKPIPEFTREIIFKLMNNAWSGNIRQLRNTIEQIVILSDNGKIPTEYLPSFIQPSSFTPERSKLNTSTENNESEKQLIQNALQTTYGNKSAAAKLLNFSRGTLYNKMRKYGID